MALVVIAAASLAALRKNFGAPQSLSRVPGGQVFATSDLRGGRYYWAESSTPPAAYKNCRIGGNESPSTRDRVVRNSNYFLLPYIEPHDLGQLGYQYVRVRPANYPPVLFPASGFQATRATNPNLILIADSVCNAVFARETLGFEKTFLDAAWPGVRLVIPGLMA